MDFRLGGILRRKEVIELILAVDLARVHLAELSRTLEKVLLNGIQNFRRDSDEFLDRHGPLSFDRLIAAADNQRVLLEVARPNFDPHRYTFFDPFPVFDATTEIAPVHLYFQWKIGKVLYR